MAGKVKPEPDCRKYDNDTKISIEHHECVKCQTVKKYHFSSCVIVYFCSSTCLLFWLLVAVFVPISSRI